MSVSYPFPVALYMIATPIGNGDDLTIRAKLLLSQLTILVCEDTRHTKRLLAHHQIHHNIMLLRGDEHTQERIQVFVIEQLKKGISVGFVSDAGTPGICDPGALLVQAVRSEGLSVLSLPGPSSVAAFLSIAGIRESAWNFIGFFPRSPGDIERLCQKFQKEGGFWIGLESPHRLLKTVSLLIKGLPEQTPIKIAKELTKTYEYFWYGSLGDIYKKLLEEKDMIKGEFIIGLDVSKKKASWNDAAISLEPILGRKKTAAWIAEHFQASSSEVYEFLTHRSV